MVMVVGRQRARRSRFPLRVPALVEPVPSTGSPSAGLMKNMSRCGMLLQLRQRAQAGALVRVTLRLRHRVPFTLTGTVRWVRPHRDAAWELGIQFGAELPAALVAAIAAEELQS